MPGTSKEDEVEAEPDAGKEREGDDARGDPAMRMCFVRAADQDDCQLPQRDSEPRGQTWTLAPATATFDTSGALVDPGDGTLVVTTRGRGLVRVPLP